MPEPIQSIEDLITAVRLDTESWHPQEPKWFRGEPVSEKALMPTLYRDGFTLMRTRCFKCFALGPVDFTMVRPRRWWPKCSVRKPTRSLGIR
jgi:hypothetical protein